MSSINVRHYFESVVRDRRRSTPNVKLGDRLCYAGGTVAGAEKLRVGVKIYMWACTHYAPHESRTQFRRK